MLEQTDRLEGENRILKNRIDMLYREELDDADGRTRLIVRIEDIIHMAEDRVAAIPPYRERESCLTMTAFADELRHVIRSLREPDATPPASSSS